MLLEVIGVRKRYADADGTEIEILRGLDLSLDAGETLAIVGQSGCGKSTLLNLIGALDRPDAGEIRLAGRNLGAASEAELAEVRSRELGFVFQLHHLLPQCSVLENVLVPTLVAGSLKRTEPAEARAKRLLERVGLSHRLTHRPGQLSGGERQRVAVVRALINEPKLLLADEPTGALDRASGANLSQLLVELNREEKVSLLVVTHSATLAEQMARIEELRDGRLAPRERSV